MAMKWNTINEDNTNGWANENVPENEREEMKKRKERGS